MARIGKRTARRQLSKDRPADSQSEDSDNDTNSDQEQQQPTAIPVEKRVMARPVPRSQKLGSQPAENPFKGLSLPALPTHNTIASAPTLDSTQREAIANIKALNKSFLAAVQKSLDKDDHIDLSTLFPQYSKHREVLDGKYEYARELREREKGKQLGLGFTEKRTEVRPSFVAPEIRPVSVEVPAFAFNPPPPTPTIVKDSNIDAGKPKEPFVFPSFQVTTSTTTAMPSPQSQPQASKPGAFSFPSVPSLPAFGSATSNSATASATDKPLFSFGVPSPSFTPPTSTAAPQADTKDAGGEEDDEDAIPEGEEESFHGVRTNEELLKRGAGEEEEEELLPSLRCKLFIYDSASAAWTDLGIGFVKVNKRPDAQKARILCRAEGSGRVLLNAFIDPQVSSATWQDGKRDVHLTLFNQDSRLAKYLVRTKDVEQARSLHSAIEACARQ